MSDSTSSMDELESFLDYGKVDMMIKVWETDLNITDNTNDSSGESNQEEARLNSILTKLILPTRVMVDDFDNEPIVQVFKAKGSRHLLTLHA
jgi:hypothetical protein